jgi:broad specificity phosphatase PhoE
MRILRQVERLPLAGQVVKGTPLLRLADLFVYPVIPISRFLGFFHLDMLPRPRYNAAIPSERNDMIRIILVRHGRTAWNAHEGQGERFRGILDIPLAEEGVAQAVVTARRLASEPLSAVYASPLQRAADTAQIIADSHSLAVHTLPGLGSMDYGDWTGQFYTDVRRQWPDLFRRWLADPFAVRVPGGESLVDLRDRAVAALHQALSRHGDGDTIALVSHQAVTRALVCAMAGMPDPGYWWIRQSLCNLSFFTYDPAAACPDAQPGSKFVVVGLNDTCHLSPALPRTSGDDTRILLVRHGQTAWNAGAGEERFRGRTDLPLDSIGHAQAGAVAARLASEPIAALYTSPLLRARQTFAPLAERLGLLVQPHAGLMDIEYGQFQGMTHAEAAAAFPEQYEMWSAAPSQVHFPHGERLADVQARLLSLLDELAARHAGQTVALVGHQIVNKVLACTVLGLDLDQIGRIQQDTASIDVFQQTNGKWHTLRLNDTCHLVSAIGHDA